MPRINADTLDQMTDNELLALLLDDREANDDRVDALRELDLRAGTEPDEDWYIALEEDTMELDSIAADIWATSDGSIPRIDDEGNEHWLPEA